MEEQNNYEIKESKKNNMSTIIFSVILIILLGIIGYLTFTRVMEHSNKQNNQETEQKQENESIDNKDEEKELDINSGLVQGLFKLVNVDTVHMKWKEQDKITAEEMTYEDKFSLAINAMKYTSVNCANITTEITEIFGKELEIYCGDYSDDYMYYDPVAKKWVEDDHIVYVNLYLEKDIKNAMYQIFGKDYYERKTEIEDSSYDYAYIESQKGYVRVHGQKGGIKPIYEETLQSAKMINDTIILTVNGDSGESKATLKYTFKFNQNDNSYYFNKLEINK